MKQRAFQCRPIERYVSSMKAVAFHFDYASPWAYLANELLPRKLPGATVTYHPTYLRGLETFSKGMPYTSAKLLYQMRDIARCAAYEGVTLVAPTTFPIDGLQALRAAFVARDSGA